MTAVTVTDLTGRLAAPERLAAAARRVLAAEGRALRLHVAVGDDALLRRLNREFRGEGETTDVLAFPLGGGEGAAPAGDVEGEIVVNLDAAEREAAERGLPPGTELTLYVIHGVLHLLGYDDGEPAARARMRAAEARHLRALGLAPGGGHAAP